MSKKPTSRQRETKKRKARRRRDEHRLYATRKREEQISELLKRHKRLGTPQGTIDFIWGAMQQLAKTVDKPPAHPARPRRYG